MRRTHSLWPLLALLALAAAFQNIWMWADDRLLFGLPVNLVYHVALCVATSAIMLVVVRRAWPGDADED